MLFQIPYVANFNIHNKEWTCYYPHFTDYKTEVQNNFPSLLNQKVEEPSLQTQAVWLQIFAFLTTKPCIAKQCWFHRTDLLDTSTDTLPWKWDEEIICPMKSDDLAEVEAKLCFLLTFWFILCYFKLNTKAIFLCNVSETSGL